jgi:hypothetical protein
MVEMGDFVLKGIEMETVRFEPLGLPFSIQPALAYWLRLGDKIAPRWLTVEHHWERKGAMCSFDNNTSTADCQVCDYCNPPASLDGPPCMGLGPFGNFSDALGIVVDYGFIRTDNPALIGSWDADIYAACSNAMPNNPRFFEPVANGLYRLRSSFSEDAFNIRGGGVFNGEIKLHVVHNDEDDEQTTAYQLRRQTVDGGRAYWTWEIEGDPLWLENFSPYLRVTDIRILRGRCADGSAQGKQCAIPNESIPVRPSRILFLPNYQNTVDSYIEGTSQFRCYNAPDAADGIDGNFINLYSCRKECFPDSTTRTCTYAQTERRDATPTYLAASASGPRPMDKLTWLVEFNTSEGADADLTTPANDPMPQDAVLIIEFTIQAN